MVLKTSGDELAALAASIAYMLAEQAVTTLWLFW